MVSNSSGMRAGDLSARRQYSGPSSIRILTSKVGDQVIRKNPASGKPGRGTEKSADVLVGPPRDYAGMEPNLERRSTAVVRGKGALLIRAPPTAPLEFSHRSATQRSCRG